jgi:hypothetical protein
LSKLSESGCSLREQDAWFAEQATQCFVDRNAAIEPTTGVTYEPQHRILQIFTVFFETPPKTSPSDSAQGTPSPKPSAADRGATGVSRLAALPTAFL